MRRFRSWLLVATMLVLSLGSLVKGTLHMRRLGPPMVAVCLHGVLVFDLCWRWRRRRDQTTGPFEVQAAILDTMHRALHSQWRRHNVVDYHIEWCKRLRREEERGSLSFSLFAALLLAHLQPTVTAARPTRAWAHGSTPLLEADSLPPPTASQEILQKVQVGFAVTKTPCQLDLPLSHVS